MTDDQKKLAAYLFNTLNGATVTIPARESEMMTMAKSWLRECAEEKAGPQEVIEDANDTA